MSARVYVPRWKQQVGSREQAMHPSRNVPLCIISIGVAGGKEHGVKSYIIINPAPPTTLHAAPLSVLQHCQINILDDPPAWPAFVCHLDLRAGLECMCVAFWIPYVRWGLSVGLRSSAADYWCNSMSLLFGACWGLNFRAGWVAVDRSLHSEDHIHTQYLPCCPTHPCLRLEGVERMWV